MHTYVCICTYKQKYFIFIICMEFLEFSVRTQASRLSQGKVFACFYIYTYIILFNSLELVANTASKLSQRPSTEAQSLGELCISSFST